MTTKNESATQKTVSKLINIQLREMPDDYKIYKLKQNIESITATF